MIPSATPFELAWTIPSLIGLILNAWALLDVIVDRHIATARGTTPLVYLVARAHQRDETIRVLVQAIHTFVGIVAVLTVPSEVAPWLATLVLVTFIGSAVLLSLNAVLSRWDRHRIMSLDP